MILLHKMTAYPNYKKLISLATCYQAALPFVAFTWGHPGYNMAPYAQGLLPHTALGDGTQVIFCKNGTPVHQGTPFTQNTTTTMQVLL